MSRFLELVRSRPVIYDGSIGATILNMQLTPEDYGGIEGCTDYLTLVQPSVIESIHASYLEVGCDVLETNTFGGSLIKLEEYEIGDQTYEINLAAASLARGVADRRPAPHSISTYKGRMAKWSRFRNGFRVERNSMREVTRRIAIRGMVLVAISLALPFSMVMASQDATPDPGTPVASGGVVREVLGSSDPADAPGELFELARYTIPAGTVLPVHTHPGVQMAIVESGTLTYHVVADGEVLITRADGTEEVAGPGETVTFEVGDAWVEAEGMVHYAENLTDQPVVLISSSLFDADEPSAEVVTAATPAA